MKDLEQKVAFITGGSRGMGAAIARRLSAEGAAVAFTHSGKREDRANEVLRDIEKNGVSGLALVADSGDPEALVNALQVAAEKLGPINILVNNAGVYTEKLLGEYTLEEYDEMMNVNVKAVFVAGQFAARQMKHGDRIITIGSNMADRVTAPHGTLYATSKSALIGLTKGAARDLGARGVTVNLIQPGPINTEMNPETAPHAESLKHLTALGRYGTTSEIAALVAYLASRASQFMTGTALTIDGGYNV